MNVELEEFGLCIETSGHFAAQQTRSIVSCPLCCNSLLHFRKYAS